MDRPFSVCTALLVLLLSIAKAAPERPNVVLIMADDLGYADTGYRGSRDMVTPHIDSIAQGGVLFSSGYVTAPICGPSRAGLLSGIYQNRFGFEDNPGPYRLRKDVKIGIPKTVRTLPERMKALGYVTGMVGKSHTGINWSFIPTAAASMNSSGLSMGPPTTAPMGNGASDQSTRQSDLSRF